MNPKILSMTPTLLLFTYLNITLGTLFMDTIIEHQSHSTYSCTSTTTRSAPSCASATWERSSPARCWSASRRWPAIRGSHFTVTLRHSIKHIGDSAYAIQDHLFAQNPQEVRFHNIKYILVI